jgi:hypothetical protein
MTLFYTTLKLTCAKGVKRATRQLDKSWAYCVTTLTKIVALAVQFLDKKDKEEPVLALEEESPEYEA